jgi:hypothetical protein
MSPASALKLKQISAPPKEKKSQCPPAASGQSLPEMDHEEIKKPDKKNSWPNHFPDFQHFFAKERREGRPKIKLPKDPPVKPLFDCGPKPLWY